MKEEVFPSAIVDVVPPIFTTLDGLFIGKRYVPLPCPQGVVCENFATFTKDGRIKVLSIPIFTYGKSYVYYYTYDNDEREDRMYELDHPIVQCYHFNANLVTCVGKKTITFVLNEELEAFPTEWEGHAIDSLVLKVGDKYYASAGHTLLRLTCEGGECNVEEFADVGGWLVGIDLDDNALIIRDVEWNLHVYKEGSLETLLSSSVIRRAFPQFSFEESNVVSPVVKANGATMMVIGNAFIYIGKERSFLEFSNLHYAKMKIGNGVVYVSIGNKVRQFSTRQARGAPPVLS